MSIKTIEEKLNGMFEELVPASGKADTLAGEIVRSICRIGYRNYNDGDHIGQGYGRETCNPAARFLAKKCDDKVARCVADAWGIILDGLYDKALEKLEIAVCEYRSYTIKDVANSVTLDGERMNAYSGSTLLNDKVQFTEWPTLKVGNNNISWVGNVRSVYIAPNWRAV